MESFGGIFTKEDYQQCVKISNLLLAVTNREGRFVKLSANWATYLGRSIEEIYSAQFFDFLHPDDFTKTRHEFEKIKAWNSPTVNFKNRFKKPNGESVQLVWNSSVTPDGNILSCAMAYPAHKDAQFTGDEMAKFEEVLTPTEFRIFNELMNSLGRVVFKKQISERIYRKSGVSDKTINVHLSNIRKKISNLGLQIVSPGKGKWKLNKKSDQKVS